MNKMAHNKNQTHNKKSYLKKKTNDGKSYKYDKLKTEYQTAKQKKKS